MTQEAKVIKNFTHNGKEYTESEEINLGAIVEPYLIAKLNQGFIEICTDSQFPSQNVKKKTQKQDNN